MFLGHLAVGLAAKRVAPRTSLGALLAAALLLDLAWPVFVLLGVERVRVDPGNTAVTPLDFVSYPWTHSLLLASVWAAGFAVAYRRFGADPRAAWVIGGLVLSHWVLDLLSHRPDLPLAPGAVKVGLGLWRSVPATVAVEGALFAAGVALYAAETRSRGRAGRVGLWALVAVLAALYAANLAGPPPPSATAVAVAGLLLPVVLLPCAAWVDGRREVRLPARRRLDDA